MYVYILCAWVEGVCVCVCMCYAYVYEYDRTIHTHSTYLSGDEADVHLHPVIALLSGILLAVVATHYHPNA